MEIDRDWGSWTGSLLEGSLANSLMKTADESRSGKPDKKRMVTRVNAPGWSFGVCFFVCDSKLSYQKGLSWIYKHNYKS